MKITLTSRLGGGAFADVWKARDGLDRDVAVKIVHASAAVRSSALAHAKALARTRHPNIVSVISLERVKDPDSGAAVDGIVMELIEGMTLEERFQGSRLSASEARRIGAAVASGIAHIHAQGMEHSDLHAANVMIGGDTVKIIDILYTHSLALLSSGSRQARLRRDRTSLKLILQHLIAHSHLSSADTVKFDQALTPNSSIGDVLEAFLKVVGSDETDRFLTQVYDRLRDENFTRGKEPAALLLNDTPRVIMPRLIAKIINDRTYDYDQQDYVRAVWKQLSPEERSALQSHLGAELEKQLPKEHWWPHLRLLTALLPDTWRALRPRFARRLEQLIVEDVLNGHVDPTGKVSRASRHGNLGIYARSLWPYFAKRYELMNNLLTLLQKNVYTQNYVGKYFLATLAELVDGTDLVDEAIRAIKRAVNDDATLVIENLKHLPEEWRTKIRPEQT